MIVHTQKLQIIHQCIQESNTSRPIAAPKSEGVQVKQQPHCQIIKNKKTVSLSNAKTMS